MKKIKEVLLEKGFKKKDNNLYEKILDKNDDFTYAILKVDLKQNKIFYEEYEGRCIVGEDELPINENIEQIITKWSKDFFQE